MEIVYTEWFKKTEPEVYTHERQMGKWKKERSFEAQRLTAKSKCISHRFLLSESLILFSSLKKFCFWHYRLSSQTDN